MSFCRRAPLHFKRRAAAAFAVCALLSSLDLYCHTLRSYFLARASSLDRTRSSKPCHRKASAPTLLPLSLPLGSRVLKLPFTVILRQFLKKAHSEPRPQQIPRVWASERASRQNKNLNETIKVSCILLILHLADRISSCGVSRCHGWKDAFSITLVKDFLYLCHQYLLLLLS